MKNSLPILLVLVFFLFFPRSLAKPFLLNVSLNPENVWFDENISISLTCYDLESNVTKVYGRITEPIQSEDLAFNYEGDYRYTLQLTSLYFDPNKPPQYVFSIYCMNVENQTNSTSVKFNVSEFKANIIPITAPSYLGDVAEIYVSIKKDDSPLNENINFKLKLGGQDWSKTSFYDPEKELWIVKFSVPNVLGTYDLDLDVTANLPSYNTKRTTLKSSLEVKKPIEFKVISLDKDEVRPNDMIKVSLSASERGENIMLKKDYLSFQVGPEMVKKEKVILSSAGDHFDAEIKLPDLPPGLYELKITFNYKNSSLTQVRNIGYVLPISGKIVDLNEKGIETNIRFLKNGKEKRISTDSSGLYSGYIVPGTYTLQIIFPQSTLYLYNVTINKFEDPIKYYFFDTDIEGIKTAGLFVYEIVLEYSRVKILMNYDEKKIPNEKNIVLYRCSEFNPSNKICSTEWEERDAEVDTVRNLVTIESEGLSAYVVGTKKTLSLDISLDKTVFGSRELMKIKGVVRDESGEFISNAGINATIEGTNIRASTFSGNNGVFDLELLSPEEEGIYNLSLRVEKKPYVSSSKSITFEVAKTRSLALLVPDTIKMKQGERRTFGFSIVNTGQTELTNLSLFLLGLPEGYFTFQDKVERLKVGQEVKIPVEFKIPENASETTISLTFKVNSSEISREEIIGFTILKKDIIITTTIKESSPFLSIPTAAITLPTFSLPLPDVSYGLVIGLTSILVAYLLRRRKKAGVKERNHIKNLLFDVKTEIKRKKIVHSRK
jgi:hypothetical protein